MPNKSLKNSVVWCSYWDIIQTILSMHLISSSVAVIKLSSTTNIKSVSFEIYLRKQGFVILTELQNYKLQLWL